MNWIKITNQRDFVRAGDQFVDKNCGSPLPRSSGITHGHPYIGSAVGNELFSRKWAVYRRVSDPPVFRGYARDESIPRLPGNPYVARPLPLP